MTQRKDVATNPEQAAQDIMVYLLTFSNESEKAALLSNTDDILESARKEYSGESLSYFWQFCILPFSRYRGDDLDKAIAAIADYKGLPEEIFGRFIILVCLLSSGACKSTSLNTYVLDRLVAATGKYNPIDDNEVGIQKTEKDNETSRMRLRRIFLEKANTVIKQREERNREDEARKLLAAKDREVVKPRRFEEKQKQEFIGLLDDFLKGKYRKVEGKSAEKLDVKKFKQSELAKKHAILLTAFGRRQQPSVEIKTEAKNKTLAASPVRVGIDELNRSPVMQALLAKRNQANMEAKGDISSPLPVSYQETVVTVSKTTVAPKNKSPQIPVKSELAKPSLNESFALSHSLIGGFFAKQHEKAVRNNVDEFDGIAMRSFSGKK